jgi:hypothetical protein
MPLYVDEITSREKARQHIAAYLEQSGAQAIFDIDVMRSEAGRQLLDESGEVQACAVVEALRQGIAGGDGGANWFLRPLRSALLRRKLPFTQGDVEAIVDVLLQEPRLHRYDVGITGLMRTIENFVAENGFAESLRQRLERLAPQLAKIHESEYRKAAERLARLLETGGGSITMIRWSSDEAWVEKLRPIVEDGDSASCGHWLALVLHCGSAAASKPSRKWLKQAAALLQPIGHHHFACTTAAVLAQIGKPARTPPRRFSGIGDQTDPTLIHEAHSDLLRGLVWCTSLIADEKLTQAVGAAADACFHKIPWIGPRSPKIGNACLFALSQHTELKAVAELSRLKTRAKHASIKKQLGKSLDAAAERVGMTAEELEEIAVPACGLTDVGRLIKQLGDVTVRLEIGAGGKAGVTWEPAGKKPQATVPAAIKDAFAADVKAIKQSAKEIDKLLSAQRGRLERLFLQQAGWSLADFRARYLDHPLVGTLARRLIWRFHDGGHHADGIWRDGRIVAADYRPLDALGNQTHVTLWHPSASGKDDVLAWRDWLEAHEVRQPFKQAHREIYLLTDAERRTAIYSNRFAAHILRQHQFAALCQERGWRYRLQGHFDSANTPALELPRWHLRVEFSVETVEAQTSEMMIYLYVGTDAVRFFRAGSFEPVALADLPPLVFSEVMRDVDLFVGVCSVGNDPTWGDGGATGRFAHYWSEYAFGDLSAAAATRRAALERVIPHLKIAERCSFQDRFLVVRGDLRTYKIHLGSGNILMLPNDQYLCIVPNRGVQGAGSRVFLPFEGDDMLSVILSKALLLANDTAITDPTILRQITE